MDFRRQSGDTRVPDVRDYLVQRGWEAYELTPDHVNALIKADTRVMRYARRIKHANFALER